MAHHLAAWLGIPAGIVIAAMVILRRKGMPMRARRQQARRQPAGTGSAVSQHITGRAEQSPARTRPEHAPYGA